MVLGNNPSMAMASEEKVKRYLAYWFALGRKIVLPKSNKTLLPLPVFQGSNYSPEFESCWQYLLSTREDAYLEGTEETIKQLLSSAWEITDCARCTMPVPIASTGIPSLGCPCSDLPSWPNLELPLPRFPVDNSSYLQQIRERLNLNDLPGQKLEN